MALAAPQQKFGFFVDCEPPRCDATSAETVGYDLGLIMTIAIMFTCVVAGTKISCRNALLPTLAFACASMPFLNWYHHQVSYYRDTIRAELDAHREYVGDEQARKKVPRAWIIGQSPSLFSSDAIYGWMELALAPFLVGCVYGVTRRRRNSSYINNGQSDAADKSVDGFSFEERIR